MKHSLQSVIDELVRLEPKEVIFPAGIQEAMTSALQSLPIARIVPVMPQPFGLEESKAILTKNFPGQSYRRPPATWPLFRTSGCGWPLHYLADTQPTLVHAHTAAMDSTPRT